jgi:hypothetical protein|tara:strand:+ start:117 stop:254 length:138 start_codon:yes stop_codon:yes gene_type:complete
MNLNHTLNALCAVGSHPKQRVEKIPILSDTTDEKDSQHTSAFFES